MLLSANEIHSPAFGFSFPRETIGNLDAESAARLMTAVSDVAIIVDREGVIRDVAVSALDMPVEGFVDIVDRRWVDTVTSDSRPKVEEILRSAAGFSESGWREVNQKSPRGSIPLRFMGIGAGGDGRVIALGRDLRGDEVLQQRILQAQQAMERDYVKLRQAESRYRVLFQVASEAVLIVDPATKRIVEANPAVGDLLGVDYRTLASQPFVKLFHAENRDAAAALLSDANARARTEPLPVRLADGRTGYTAIASLFRQDGVLHGLVSLSPAKTEFPAPENDSNRQLLHVLNRIPDAFVVTDETLNIVDVNLAFLELCQVASAEAAKGESLTRFVGKPNVDLRVLIRNLHDHGSVTHFSTVVRTIHGDQADVELSAVWVQTGLEACLGFVIRPSRRPLRLSGAQLEQLPHTAEELTRLVGRSSLREIVAETTQVIERMCIKAALNLTGNNRAAAAEILGLSRQSLYSKLGRQGFASTETDGPPEH